MSNIVNKGDNANSISQKQEVISSLEILVQINNSRDKEGRVNLTHSNLLKAIRSEFEEEIGLVKLYESSYVNLQGKKQPMFNLTVSQSRQILFKESKNVRREMNKFLDQIEQDIESKGYTTFDGQLRFTTKESIAISMFAEAYQSYYFVKDAMNKAIDKLAVKYNGSYAKAHKTFSDLAGYNLNDLKESYLQQCLVTGDKELKSLSKFDLALRTCPLLFVNILIASIEILNGGDYTRLVNGIKEFVNIKELSVNKDCSTIALIGCLNPENVLKNIDPDHKIFLLLN